MNLIPRKVKLKIYSLGACPPACPPLLSTSARIEDGPPLAEPLEIHQRLGKIVDMVVDAGMILPYPSSILDLRTDPPTVIREGKGDVSWLKPEGEVEAAS